MNAINASLGRRPSPALIVSMCALVVAMTGAAAALPGRATVNGGDIKRNAVVSKHVKGKSLKGGDLRDETIASKQVGDDAVDPSDVASLAIADDSLVRVTATPGVTEFTARAAAPATELYREGDLTVYAKCFRDATEGDVLGEIYVSTSANGALLSGEDDHPASPTSALIGEATPEDQRQLDVAQVEGDNQGAFATGQGAAAAPDGTYFDAATAIGVKQGVLPGGNGAFGDGNACLFGLTLTS